MANLKDAFALENKNIVKDKNILIVDDILTTGATAESMAKLFKNAKANKVCVLTFARTDIENKK